MKLQAEIGHKYFSKHSNIPVTWHQTTEVISDMETQL